MMCLREHLQFGVYSLLCALLLIASCTETYTPKPHSYFRIELPEKSYQEYNSDACPFRFQYPVYAAIVRDSVFFSKPAENNCWLDIVFTTLNAKLHLSYKEINAENTLAKLLEDSHTLSFKHTQKAQYIDESVLRNANRVSGILYEIGGNAASNVQFFLTDSMSHYLRGSLYFSATPNEDSLAPVIQFVKEDMMRMINSFEWKEDEAAAVGSGRMQ